jgi:predicted DNA-binding transcriptional regulator YafY
MGIPIETIEGTDGQGGIEGYRILRDAYALPEVSFSGDELAVLGLAAKVWEQASLGASAQRALRKLESMGDGSVIEGPVGVEVRIATSDASFPLIMEAIRQRRVISFDYRKPAEHDAAGRTVQPWGVVSRRGHWYLVGHDVDRHEPRVFRLSRISGSPSMSGPTGAYDVPSGVDVASMISASNPDEVQTALVRIEPGAAISLRRRATDIVDDVASVPFSDVDVLATEIVQYADAVLVLSPDTLRLAVIERLRQLAGIAS